jgi:ABC-type dipeptide/oligopeptide/nickel transport system permease component
MGTYIVRRILQAILILFGLSIVFFLILHLTPGGPCQAFEGQGFAAAAKEQACTHRLGLGPPEPLMFAPGRDRFIKANSRCSHTTA